MKQKNSIFNVYLFHILLAIILFAAIVGYLWINALESEMEADINRTRQSTLSRQQEQLRYQVKYTLEHIDQMRIRIESQLKDTIQRRVFQASKMVAMAFEIFGIDPNQGWMVIKSTWERLSENDEGYGDFIYDIKKGDFIAGFDGTIDRSGTPIPRSILQDICLQIEQNPEGFYFFTTSPMSGSGAHYQRIIYFSLLPSLGWVIGSGIDLDRIKKRCQDQILFELAQLNHDPEIRLFGMTFDGVVLFSGGKGTHSPGISQYHLIDANGIKVFSLMRKAVESPQGGYIRYDWPEPATGRSIPRIGFVMQYTGWDWIVGAETSISEVDQKLSGLIRSWEDKIRTQFIRLVLLFLALFMVIILVTLLIGQRVKKNLDQIQRFFQKSIISSTKLDYNVLDFREFQELALSLNRMISRRHRIEKAFWENRRNFRALVKNAHDGIVIATGDMKLVFANPAIADMTGYSIQELLNLRIPDLVHSDDVGILRERFANPFADWPRPDQFEIRMKRKDDTWIHVEGTGARSTWRGQMAGLAIIRDITHKHAVMEAMKKSEFRYRVLSELTSDFVYAFYVDASAQMRLEWVTGALMDVTGYTSNTLRDHGDWLYCVLPEDVQILEQMRQNLLKGTPASAEYRIIRKDNQIRWVRDHARPIVEEGENTEVRIVGAVKDITENRVAAEAIREREHRFRTLFEHATDGIVIHNMDGQILEVNQQLCSWLGYDYPALIEMRIQNVISPKQVRFFNSQLKKTIRKGVCIFEMEYQSRDGVMIPAEISARTFEFEGQPAFLSIVRDISDRKRAEQEKKELEAQFQQVQRLESIGTLAGGIAHEFNNILSSIIGFTEIVLMDLEENSRSYNNLNKVLKAGERARVLVEQILTFCRHTPEEPSAMSIRPIVKETLKLLRSTLPVTIDIREQIESDAKIMADPTGIHQILLNLCTNAAHAMGDAEGTLSIGLTETQLDTSFTSRYPGMKPGQYVVLSVEDTGHGIPPELLDRIFEPFFSTHPRGEGTGMGLSVVHGIVSSMGGTVTVTSRLEEGSRFDVYLPTVDTMGPINEKIPKIRRAETSANILFVDDEINIVDVAGQMLSVLGYHVTTALNGDDALALVEKDPDQFQLVITDMTMPGMTGKVLAEKIRKIRPDIPIIICTGYSEQLDQARAKAMGIQGYLLKPVSLETFGSVIQDVLDNPEN